MNGIISDLLGYLMQLKQLSSWGSFNSIKDKVHNEIITSWLLEKGPITKRIKKTGSFQLNLIQDKLSKISIDDKKFINTESEKIKKREVILLCNDLPIVFAQTIIPTETIENGFSELGNLGLSHLVIFYLKKIFLLEIVLFLPLSQTTQIPIGVEKQNILSKDIDFL
jgi:chorismate--pyruvate lyase